jgi:hypothetical protein
MLRKQANTVLAPTMMRFAVAMRSVPARKAASSLPLS